MHDKNACCGELEATSNRKCSDATRFLGHASCSLHRNRSGPPSAIPFPEPVDGEKVALILPTLLNASARCTRDLGLRKVLDDEVFALRQELTEHLTHRAGELEAAARGEMQPNTEGAAA